MKLQHQLSKLAVGLVASMAFVAAGAQTLTDVPPGDGTTTNYALYKGSTLQFNSSYQPDRTLSTGSSTFDAYCIDPLTGFSNGQTYSTVSLDSFLNGTTTSGYAGQVARSGYSGYNLSNTSATQSRVLSDLKELFSWAYTDSQTSADKSAAFGMAVWEIMMQDGGANGTAYAANAGQIRSYGSNGNSTSNTGDTVETATNNYLTALNTGNWTSLLGLTATQTSWTYTVYYDTSSPYNQNFLRVTAPAPVPEPGSLALVGLALAGVYAARRRRQQAA